MAEAAFKDFDDAENRIDRPGERVLIDYEFHGDVVGGTVVIKGGSVHGTVEGIEVFVDGLVDGKVTAKMLTVSAGGSLRGEGRADMARIAGNVRGLIIAETALVKSTARIEGYVLADSWGVEPGAQVKATIYAEAGVSTRQSLVDTARAGLARAEAKASGVAPAREEVPAVEPAVEETVAEAKPAARRPVLPLRAPEPVEQEPDQLARDLRETVIRELGHPAAAPVAPVQVAVPAREPARGDMPAIGRLFRLDGAVSGDDRRPRII